MEGGTQTSALRIDFADQGIEQERHVVVDGNKHAFAVSVFFRLVGGVEEVDKAFTRLAAVHARKDKARKRCQRVGRVAVDVFGCRIAIKRLEEGKQRWIALGCLCTFAEALSG